MSIIQIFVPFIIVVLGFAAGHFLFPAENSGIYIPELSIDLPEEVAEEFGEDVLATDIDPETGQILPDKYNYLKIENVFSGRINSICNNI